MTTQVPRRRPLAASIAVLAGLLIVATGCADAGPGTVAQIRDQVTAFEEELDQALWPDRTPETLWEDLAPTTPVPDVGKGGTFPEETSAPMIVAHDVVADDRLALTVFAAASGFAGGGFMSDTAQKTPRERPVRPRRGSSLRESIRDRK